jgi:colanic acid/amylovoran biosynthesis glycosyltransferase
LTSQIEPSGGLLAVADAPAVAHFRPVWFRATETFLYNTVSSARRTRPLLVGYERARAEAFPHDGPVLSLYPPGGVASRLRRARLRFGGEAWEPGFVPRRVVPWLERHGARLLHAHFGDVGAGLLPLARATGLPLFASFYGHDASRLGRLPAWRERFRALFAEADALLVEGPALGASLCELGCPEEKIAIQRIAIDLSCYAFRERKPPEGRAVTLFFCARFTEKKGLLDALAAVAQAREHHPDLVFRNAGDGPQRVEVDAAIHRLGLADVVRRLGMLSHADLCAELDRCDLFVQPSVTAADGDSEGGAPTTLLEAQACGVPIATTDHADIPNVVDPGRSALLSPQGDACALAENLCALLDAPDRWAAMGRAGRAWVERHHGVAGEGERLETRYLDAIARAR